MTRYLLTRLGQAALVLWAAYTVTFLILYALPGDAVSLLLGEDGQNDLTEDQLAEVRARYGLDKPLLVQYGTRLAAALTGDLGHSWVSSRPVTSLLGEAFAQTAQIAAAGLALGLLVGATIAIAATYTRHGWLGALLTGLPPLGVAIPSFWLGLVLLQVFSFAHPIFPAMGNQGPASLVLPAVTLAVPTAATVAQLLNKSLQTTLTQPYIETARAKGASRARVHLRHALRNAALPTLTLAGLLVGGVLGGSVVTETVFSRAGLGRLAASAVVGRDVPVVLGVVVLAAVVFVLVNLVVDVVYPLVDPRIVTRHRDVDGGVATPAEPDAAGPDAPAGPGAPAGPDLPDVSLQPVLAGAPTQEAARS